MDEEFIGLCSPNLLLFFLGSVFYAELFRDDRVNIVANRGDLILDQWLDLESQVLYLLSLVDRESN